MPNTIYNMTVYISDIIVGHGDGYNTQIHYYLRHNSTFFAVHDIDNTPTDWRLYF